MSFVCEDPVTLCILIADVAVISVLLGLWLANITQRK